MNISFRTIVALISVGIATAGADAVLAQGADASAAQGTTELRFKPATRKSGATKASILAAAVAGKRIVAVGDHGVVLLSDDDGATFRQARAVPVQSALTGVHFADEKNGWAVGHRGVVLHSTDGGESWELQRQDTSVDQPLFSVFFWDANEGIAVGLWSLVLKTTDGGKSWETVTLPAPPMGGKADKNLLRIFPGKSGSVLVTAEQGLVLKSADRGKTWRYFSTGYKGTFWTGTSLADGSLLVGGLRGSVFLSRDEGLTWSALKVGIKSSITDMAAHGDSAVVVGLDGLILQCSPVGEECSGKQQDDRQALTAVVLNSKGTPVIFSKRGPLDSVDASPAQ